MYSRVNDIEYLELLVQAGKTLRTIHGAVGCGASFTLKKLQKYGLADPSLTVKDCKSSKYGTVLKNIYETFPYEEYVQRHIIGKEKLFDIAVDKNFNLNSLKHVASKYKARYKQEQTVSSI